MSLLDAAQRLFVSARATVTRFFRDERGVSTVEYALIVVAIIAILGVAAGTMSEAFTDLFDDLSQRMSEGVDEVTQNAGS